VRSARECLAQDGDTARVLFHNGAVAEADVVVGAARQHFLPNPSPLEFGGNVRRMCACPTWVARVNPGVAIDARSQAVHGITDDLADERTSPRSPQS
jgi:glycine cleavage system pyridoxal-binding protein P